MNLAIITPCYNAGELILHTVESVSREASRLREEFPDWEVLHVIINDHSDDETTLEHLQFLKGQIHCRVLDNEGRRGPAGARNFGLRNTEASWFGFMDADDYYEVDGLYTLVAKAVNEPDAEWVSGKLAVQWPDGRLEDKNTNYPNTPFDEGDGWAKIPPQQALKYLARPPHLFLGTMIARNNALCRHGYFSEDLLFGEDWTLTLNMALDTTLYYRETRVMIQRRGHQSLTQSKRNLTSLGITPTLLAYRDPRFRPARRVLRWTLISQLRNLSDRCFAAGRKWRGLRFGLRAWSFCPWDIGLLRQPIVGFARRHD